MYAVFMRLIFLFLFLVTTAIIPGTELVEQSHSPTNDNQTKKILATASCQKKGSGKKPVYSTKKMRKSSNPEKYTKQKQDANEVFQGSYSSTMPLVKLQRIHRALSAPELKNNKK